MVVYGLILIFLALLFLVVGKKVAKTLNIEDSESSIVYVWIGIGIFAVAGTFIGIFSALSVYIFLALAAVGVWYSKKELAELASSLRALNIIGLLALISITTYWCNQAVFWYDSALYHIQSIKWLSTYGYVWGEGLVHTRFGVISSWFVLPAFLNHGVLESRVFTISGALAMLLILAHLCFCAAKVFARKGSLADYFAFFAYIIALPKILSWGISISPSPDLPIIAISILVGYLLVKDIETKNITFVKQALLLSVIATTIKLSGAALVIGVGLFWLNREKKAVFKKANLLFAGVCAALLIPNIAASIKTSGSIWYPMPIVIDTPWAISVEQAKAEIETIKNWARWDGVKPEGKDGLEWLLPRNKHDALATGKVLQHFLMIFSAIIALALLVTSIYKKRYDYMLFAVVSVLLVGFWLYSAPTLRFGIGVLVWMPAFAAAYWMWRKAKKTNKLHREWSTFAASALVVMIGIRLIGYNVIEQGIFRQLIAKEQKLEWLLPTKSFGLGIGTKVAGNTLQPVAIPMQLKTLTSGGFSYNVAVQEGLCWDAPLPCVQSELKNIVLKNKESGIQGGFVKLDSK